MNRTKRINEKELDLSEWQKLYYKHQKQYVRKRLEAIKSLHENKPSQIFLIMSAIALGTHLKAAPLSILMRVYLPIS